MEKTDSASSDHKAQRKIAASAAEEKGAYEETPFGRRRIRTIPRPIRRLVRLVAAPFVFLYRLARRRSPGGA